MSSIKLAYGVGRTDFITKKNRGGKGRQGREGREGRKGRGRRVEGSTCPRIPLSECLRVGV